MKNQHDNYGLATITAHEKRMTAQPQRSEQEVKELIAVPVWVKNLALSWESDLLAWQKKKLTDHEKGWSDGRKQCLFELRQEMERASE